MKAERFVDRQRRAVNVIFVLFVGLVSIMGGLTLCDWAFDLGWGWDRQILWLGPPMILFAGALRFLCIAILKFVGDNY